MLTKHKWGRHPARILWEGRGARCQQSELLGGRGALGCHHWWLQKAVQYLLLLLLLLLLPKHRCCSCHGVVSCSQQVGRGAQGLMVGPHWRGLKAWGDWPHAGQDLDQHVLAPLLVLLGHDGGSLCGGTQQVRQQARGRGLLQAIPTTAGSHTMVLHGWWWQLACRPEQVFLQEGPLRQRRGCH